MAMMWTLTVKLNNTVQHMGVRLLNMMIIKCVWHGKWCVGHIGTALIAATAGYATVFSVSFNFVYQFRWLSVVAFFKCSFERVWKTAIRVQIFVRRLFLITVRRKGWISMKKDDKKALQESKQTTKHLLIPIIVLNRRQWRNNKNVSFNSSHKFV